MLAPLALGLLVTCVASCGEEGLLPTTVNPGPDFVQEDVIFDEEFYYCRVEPELFALRDPATQTSCGAGKAGMDAANGCHFSVTKFRLTEYMPKVSDTCQGDALGPTSVVPVAAQQNYAAAQARMKRDPKLAQLLQRPLGKAQHPRQIFAENSAEAAVISQWATKLK